MDGLRPTLRFKFVSKLGEGYGGEVHLCQDADTDELVWVIRTILLTCHAGSRKKNRVERPERNCAC